MNLKVAHKVMIGFGVILLLLIFTSVSSISILADIEKATKVVDSLAVPTQQESNAIQISLLKQSKLSSRIPNSTTIGQLSAIEESYATVGEQIAKQNKALAILLKQQQLDKKLAEIELGYQVFSAGFTEMLALKRQVIGSTAQVNEYQQQLNDLLDEAGALLVDLTYLEDPDKQDIIDTIAGSAGQIEGYLIGVTNSSQGVVLISDLTELEETKAIIESSLSNIERMIDYLVRLGEDYDTDGIIESFVSEFNQANALLTNENSLFSAKFAQLESQQQLNARIVETEESVELLVGTIDSLLMQVDRNLKNLQSQVFDDVEQGRATTIIIMIIMIIAGSGIAVATVRAMIIPLRRINNVLGYIAHGDLSRQLHVDSQDEYGELSTNVNAVLTHLKNLIDDIGHNSKLLNEAAAYSSQEMQIVADSLNQQQGTVNEMTAITEELNRNADEVLSKSTHAEQQMTEALAQSESVEGLANTTANKINGLSSMLDGTAGLISVLNQEATNIGSILETIQSIADQTNLLALNAAIEAARAGEAGRGFAVVADEVRMLASRTQESTAEINSMIESLQNQTTKVVAEIDSGKEEANHCQTETERLLESLKLISEAIGQMHRMSGEISSSATHQNELSNDINAGIGQVSDISQASAEKSVSTLEYSKQVSELADKLKHSVGEFKLN
jgi:methyl-accepting chemotaxis protein